jgi:hypothetical protein
VLLAQPGLMLFVLSEMHNQPEHIASHIAANGGMMHSVIARQFKEHTAGLADEAFEGILKEKKKPLPVLIKAMLAG